MINVAPLMKSLKNIYENSNFYKEARIVSFIDRLLQILVSKIKKQVNCAAAIQSGVKGEVDEL